MKYSSLYSLLTAAALGLAMTDASALASAPIYPVGGIAEASVPAAFASLVWGPVVALTFALGLALFWLLRTPGTARKPQTQVARIPVRKPRPIRRMHVPVMAQRRMHRRPAAWAPSSV
ncbi:MAG: hypothetical protein M3O62_16300 [Pseudomonadota bacterium]|nr:hypothetical protein [Pseudomonadota bacterium]